MLKGKKQGIAPQPLGASEALPATYDRLFPLSAQPQA